MFHSRTSVPRSPFLPRMSVLLNLKKQASLAHLGGGALGRQPRMKSPADQVLSRPPCCPWQCCPCSWCCCRYWQWSCSLCSREKSVPVLVPAWLLETPAPLYVGPAQVPWRYWEVEAEGRHLCCSFQAGVSMRDNPAQEGGGRVASKPVLPPLTPPWPSRASGSGLSAPISPAG